MVREYVADAEPVIAGPSGTRRSADRPGVAWWGAWTVMLSQRGIDLCWCSCYLRSSSAGDSSFRGNGIWRPLHRHVILWRCLRLSRTG